MTKTGLIRRVGLCKAFKDDQNQRVGELIPKSFESRVKSPVSGSMRSNLKDKTQVPSI